MGTRAGTLVSGALIGALLWTSTAAATAPIDEPAEEPADLAPDITVEAVDPGNSPDIVIRGNCGPDGQLAKLPDFWLHFGSRSTPIAPPGVREVVLDATQPLVWNPATGADESLEGFGTYGCSDDDGNSSASCQVIGVDGGVVTAVTPTACSALTDNAVGGRGVLIRGLTASIRDPEVSSARPVSSMELVGSCYNDETVVVDVLDGDGARTQRLAEEPAADGPPTLRSIDPTFDIPLDAFPSDGTAMIVLEGRCITDPASGYGPGTSDARQWCHPVVLGPDAIIGYGDREADCPPLPFPEGPSLRTGELFVQTIHLVDAPRESPLEVVLGRAECATGDVVGIVAVTSTGSAIESTRTVLPFDSVMSERFVLRSMTLDDALSDDDAEPDVVVSCASADDPSIATGPLHCHRFLPSGALEPAVCSFAAAVPQPAEEIPPTGTATRALLLAAALLVAGGLLLRRLAVPRRPGRWIAR